MLPGQKEHCDDHISSTTGWTRSEHGGGAGWVRSAAGVKAMGGGSWNLRDPETVLVSMPEGWSLCVSIAGSEKWIELAHDDTVSVFPNLRSLSA